jgi:hypothetical protein
MPINLERKVVRFMGKNIEDMTREELIDALNITANMVEDQRKEHQKCTNFLFDLMKAKKG